MKIKMMFFVVILTLLFFSCKNKENIVSETKNSLFKNFISQHSITNSDDAIHDEIKKTEDDSYLIKNHQEEYEKFFKINESEYFGTTASISINSDDTNVYLQPNPNSKVLGTLRKGDIVKVCGFSSSNEEIFNHEKCFLKIIINKDFPEYYHDDYTSVAWIKNSDTDIDSNISLSKFIFSDSKICIKRNNVVSKVSFDIIENGYKNFPIFIWCSCSKDFMFNDPVGIFAIDYKNEEIIHLSDIGCIEESAWSYVTDDQRLILEDFGTYFGLRGLKIFEIDTNKILYSGLYLGTYGGLQKEDSNITVVERYSEWDIQNNMISNESIKKAEQYRESLSEDEVNSSEIIVLNRLNLETLEKSFIRCELIPEI
ncbi:hypothetical protein [Treponema sp.]|uniref:hypothetical protein n=1 Tax=Treponema sp. TaxID=166 RepID=UPI00388D000E